MTAIKTAFLFELMTFIVKGRTQNIILGLLDPAATHLCVRRICRTMS